MDQNNSRQILLSVLGVAILVVAVIGVSFAAFQFGQTGEKVNTITTGTITMSYSEPVNAINLVNALPMTDEQGKQLTGTGNTFDFSVNATIDGEDVTINYAITAVKDGGSTLPDSAVKVYLTDYTSGSESDVLAPTKVSALTKTTAGELSGAPADEYELTTGTLQASKNTSYRLRMWVADDYSDLESSGTYMLKVNVYGAAAAK